MKFNNCCIMWSIYGNEEYFKFLDLSIKSAKLISNSIDRIVIKDENCNFINEDSFIIKKTFPHGNTSKMAFRYECAAELLQTYDQVLHIDVDTIVFKNISKIFNKKIPGLSIASEASTDKRHFFYVDKQVDFSTGECWAGPLLNEKEKSQYASIPSICMGAWLADKSEIPLLKAIANDVYFYESLGFKGICQDQHAAVRRLILSGNYNFMLQEHINHQGTKIKTAEDIHKIKLSPVSIVHFAGGVQPSNEKFQKMKFFYDFIT